MKVTEYTPAQTLLKIIADGINRRLSIEESLEECNQWQHERMEAEREVFGAALTREITTNELRNARVYLLERGKKR